MNFKKDDTKIYIPSKKTLKDDNTDKNAPTKIYSKKKTVE